MRIEFIFDEKDKRWICKIIRGNLSCYGYSVYREEAYKNALEEMREFDKMYFGEVTNEADRQSNGII